MRPETKPVCPWCGQPERWCRRDCPRPVPLPAPCAACDPPAEPAVLVRWGMALCQECADEGDAIFGDGPEEAGDPEEDAYGRDV